MDSASGEYCIRKLEKIASLALKLKLLQGRGRGRAIVPIPTCGRRNRSLIVHSIKKFRGQPCDLRNVFDIVTHDT